MLKEERQKIILDKLNENDIIQVSQMTNLLDVTDTVSYTHLTLPTN